MTLNRVILKRSNGGTVDTLSEGLLCSRGFLPAERGDRKFQDMVWKVHERVSTWSARWRGDIMDVRNNGCRKVAAQYPVDNINHSG